MISVVGLYFYPVKSCRGLGMRSLRVGKTGIEDDRRWMVVDEKGMFVAQRSDGGKGVGIKSMCLIGTTLDPHNLILSVEGMPKLVVPIGYNGEVVPVQIWSHTGEAVDQGEEAAEWLTTFLSRDRPGKYRLVRMLDNGVRKSKVGQAEIAFVDSSPFLFLSDASLNDLRDRVGRYMPIDRFRPNILLSGCMPNEEGFFSHLKISGINFFGAGRCVRCSTTITDQKTAKLEKEPLATLARYRRDANGQVTFGQYFNHQGSGVINFGDKVDLLGRK